MADVPPGTSAGTPAPRRRKAARPAVVAGGTLQEYRRKRDFARTPEPAPESAVTPVPESSVKPSGFSFVVQKHAARRLHYDFRLELNGVLKSWAVTKGPSLDPRVRRLAVHVEDHPLAYGDFEGVIPKGEYGGGTVMLWDRGWWQPQDADPERAYQRGKLSFTLNGERLRGGWTLVRIAGRERNDDDRNWLLLKADDDAARVGDDDGLLVRAPDSVVSGRTMPAIAAAADRVWSGRAERSAGSAPADPPAVPAERDRLGVAASVLPAFLAPMLATQVDRPPAGDDWLHEIKFDGYRLQCRLEAGRVALRTRTGLDWTVKFPTLAAAAAALPATSALLDGEVVALLPSGVPSFSSLQEAMKSGGADDLVYFVFDIPFLNGRDLRQVPLETRKQVLSGLLAGLAGGPLRYADHHRAQGPDLLASACRMALEGVVSKRRNSPYCAGRGRYWLKSKCIARDEFVIGGFTRPSTGGPGVGALLLGFSTAGRLRYCGRVGTGFSEATSRELRQRLDALRVAASPFGPLPAPARRGVLWVDPRLVCSVEYRDWTADGHLRHAAFQELLEDRAAADVVRDDPTAAAGSAAEAAAINAGAAAAPAALSARALDDYPLSHPDRVLYPQQGLTKRGLAEYYVAVAPFILPHVADRPLSLVRCPQGQGKPCFYQKHIGRGLPPGLRQVMIAGHKGEEAHPVLDDVDGLLALAQLGVLEVHPWGAAADDVEHPDRLTFDLDPGEGVPWSTVIDAAIEVRDRLRAGGLRSFCKTTGGKGLHVVVPVRARQDWPQMHAFALAFARDLARDRPERYVITMAKKARPGRIFLDYLRNGRGATAVAAYSPRAREGAPVATPISWDELAAGIGPAHFSVTTLPRRLAALEDDPWQGMVGLDQELPVTPETDLRPRTRADTGTRAGGADTGTRAGGARRR